MNLWCCKYSISTFWLIFPNTTLYKDNKNFILKKRERERPCKTCAFHGVAKGLVIGRCIIESGKTISVILIYHGRLIKKWKDKSIYLNISLEMTIKLLKFPNSLIGQ